MPLFAAVTAVQGLRRFAAPLIGVAVVLLLCGFLWVRGDHFRNQRDAERNARAAQVTAYRDAYRRTFAEHWRLARAEEARTAAITKGTDDATDPARKDALAAADGYAVRHAAGGVRCEARAGQHPAGATGVPGAAGPAGGADRSAASADVAAASGIVISRADLDACTLNTRDLWLAQQWAARIIDDTKGQDHAD